MIDRSVSVGLKSPPHKTKENTSSSCRRPGGRRAGDDSRVAGGLKVLIMRFLKEAELGSKIQTMYRNKNKERAR
eukprot:scaffold2366_cov122-Skeletonema_dohrnii-CCMP3373.AAC.4